MTGGGAAGPSGGADGRRPRWGEGAGVWGRQPTPCVGVSRSTEPTLACEANLDRPDARHRSQTTPRPKGRDGQQVKDAAKRAPN